ncbi:MAG TPA: DUF896 domain-containing protein [Candidatus Avacidaminococcus intestinavium]|uniref:UPF0291 protein IAB06_00940 n=1 Tax=Candidatus Avacidaminococcus intestinavium TaxID=2840684 RepID=A0A9D1SL42_9FIRM|nr:DUF896 domain-containing protein [Candidatus Avacidaminococcus intestinavium]
MNISELITRINFLANKKRTVGLTDTEKAEQQQLYQEYLANIKGQLKNQLDRIEFVNENSTQH